MIIWIFILFTFLASAISHIFSAAPLFLLVVLLSYIVPGIALQKVCHFLDYQDYNKIIFSSFALGYALSLIIYITMLSIGLQKYVYLPVVSLLIISFIYIRKDIRSVFKKSGENTTFLSIVLAVCYTISFFTFQLGNLSPEIVDYQDTHPDMAFWFRNTVAATISYPVPDLSVLGRDFYYHYFSSVGLANLKYLTGIEIYDLCFTYSYIINLFLLVGALYMLSSIYVKRKMYLYLSVVILLFTTTYEPFTLTYYSAHIYYSSFGFTEGYALSLFSFFLFKKMRTFELPNAIVPILCFMAAVGAKGPLAMIVLFGILIIIGMDLLKGKEKKKNIVMAFTYIVSFLIILCLFVIDLSPDFQGQEGGGLSLSGRTIFVSGYISDWCKHLNEIFPMMPVYVILSLIIYTIINSFIICTLAAICLRRYKSISLQNCDFCLFAMFGIGYLFFLLLYQTGFSQVYFYFISLPFGSLFFLSILESKSKILNKKEKFIIGSSVMLGIIFFLSSVFVQIHKSVQSTNVHSHEAKGCSITKDELLALRWVRDNTPLNSIIFTNKVKAKDGRRTFIVSACSERQVYLEGYKYSVSPNDPVISKRREFVVNALEKNGDICGYLKEEGVSYMVIFKSIDNAGLSHPKDVVFENAAVRIIKL